MPRQRYQASAKRKSSKKDQNRLGTAFLWAAGFVVSLYATWSILFPASSGKAGAFIAQVAFGLWGGAAYLIPVLVGYALALYFFPERGISVTVLSLGGLLSLVASSSLLSLFSRWAGAGPWGGKAGATTIDALSGIVGQPGAFIASLAAMMAGLQLYFDVPWKTVFAKFGAAVREDTQAWLEARKTAAEETKKARKEGPAPKAPIPDAPKDAAKLEEKKPSGPPPILKPEAASSMISDAAVPAPKNGNGKAAVEEAKKGVRLSEIVANKKPVAAAVDKDGKPVERPKYDMPPMSLLKPGDPKSGGRPTDEQIQVVAATLEQTLRSFEIEAKITGVSPGPVITRYELAPAAGVTVSSIVSRADDLALALKAKSLRIIAPIPGKAAVGIEIPNPAPASVTLREILESPAFQPSMKLPFALGRRADGEPIVADIAGMPHLLVAGSTGSGKSVLIHDLILSLLFRHRPDELKLMMIDPKRLELTFYEGIPHLYDPRQNDYDCRVLTDPKEAAKSLKKCERLMELRYERFSKYGVRDLEGYNAEAARRGEPQEFYLVVIIDELADLMLTSGLAVEDSILRLAQMARAVGIHLVLATQRPSVDVITGVIKANLPTRIALQVISKIDSKVILDTQGAESLLGKGDLLFLQAGAQKPSRAQAPYVSEDEIRKVGDFLRAQGKPSYGPMEPAETTMGLSDDGKGANVHELIAALKLVQERRRVSQDLLKAHFGSSAKATDLLSVLEVRKFIHKPEGTNRWEISYDKIDEYLKAVRPPGSSDPS